MTLVWTLNAGDLLTAFVALMAFAGAMYVGFQQNKINKEMLNLQDAVDVYLVTGFHPAIVNQEEGVVSVPVIMIHNISVLPIALQGYIFNGMERKISPYRLPPAVQFPDAYYYIYLPIEGIDYVSFSIEFEDSFHRRWEVKGFTELRNGKWELSADMPKRKYGNT